MYLARPTWELASRILRPLTYEDWLTGYLVKSPGVVPVDISSFADAVRLLNAHKIEDFSQQDLLFPGVNSMLAWIEPHVLMEWVRTVFADWELALAIKQNLLMAGNASFPEKIKVIRELMEQRLAQCVNFEEEEARSAC